MTKSSQATYAVCFPMTETVKYHDALPKLMFDLRQVTEMLDLERSSVTNNSSGCACSGYNCGCCLHVEIDAIDLNDTVCVNLTYLPAPQYGISLTLTIDDHVLINETISAQNPPPICVDVPYLKEYASICLHFYNLTYSNNSLSGCLELEARLIYVIKETVQIGCFHIPPGNQTNHEVDSTPMDVKKSIFGRENRNTDTALYVKPNRKIHQAPRKPQSYTKIKPFH